MARRSRSRLLAPLALVCVAGAAGAIVASGNGAEQDSRPASKQERSSSSSRRSTYLVREGDTLSSIALRLGVTVSDLQDLNPESDSFTLQPGQRLKLRSGAN